MGTIAIVGMVFLIGLGVACLIMGVTLIVESLIEKYSHKNDSGSPTKGVTESHDKKTVADAV
jgi:hypothetical protein